MQEMNDSTLGDQEPMLPEGKSALTTRLSYAGMLDWISISIAGLLILTATLMVSNVGGSRSTYPYSLHIGSHLSVSSWTAIIGLEFSLFYSILLPRLAAQSGSKFLTKKLTTDGGLKLSTLLNAQETAPLKIQVRYGIRQLLAIRAMAIVATLTLSVSYKFSFEKAAIQATLMVDGFLVSRGEFPNTGFGFGLSTNLLDVAGFGDGTSVQFAKETFIVGPAFNVSSVNSLRSGRVTTCYMQPYGSSKFTSLDPKTLDITGDESYRINATSDNVTRALDIFQAPNGNLQAGSGILDSDGAISYTDFVEVNTTVCFGYISWSNINEYYKFLIESIQGVQDADCTPMSFSLSSWTSAEGLIVVGMIQETFVLDPSSSYTPLAFIVDGDAPMPLQDAVAHILATLPPVEYYLSGPTPLGQLAPYLEGCETTSKNDGMNHTLAAEGLIVDFGTGMTLFGFVLQVLLICAGICALDLCFWHPMPLGSWQAQWLSLLNDFDREEMRTTLAGTSVGKHAVKGQKRVFLSSEQFGEGGLFHLVLSTESGKVQVGRHYI
ncbi:hypothetical protein V8E51_001449 [Hyaloscypha variabilis]